MEKLSGFRFHPTDEEMVDPYLRKKNLEIDTSDVDKVISTVDIYTFDPWELPSQSMIKSKDQTWYFYCRKENKYNRGDRQSRKAKSGFWKKTGVTMDIMRKRGDREKIGEKKVLVFQFGKNQKGFGSKSGWVMHEYHATLTSPDQMMTYTICKVKFKGERREISCFPGSEIQNIHSLIPQINNSGNGGLSTGSEGSLFHSQELQNPRQFSGVLDEQQEAQPQDGWNLDDLSSADWNYVFNVDEQSNSISMQENCSHYRPPKPLSGVFDDDDDDDDDLISPTTKSIQTSSTCDSFASSNHGIDQIKTLQSPDLSINSLSLTQEVSQTLDQGTEIGEHKGQVINKKKKARFITKMIQKLVKKVHLCFSISSS